MISKICYNKQMVNPFDRNFFKFFFGFTFLLLVSFTVIYIVQQYGSSLEAQADQAFQEKTNIGHPLIPK